MCRQPLFGSIPSLHRLLALTFERPYSLSRKGDAVSWPKRIINKPNIDLEVKKGIAWAVHAFTTCGIIAGFLALVSVLKGDAVAAFMWLGLALFVDGVDGSLARRARVREYTPNFDGASLDYVIDYFTYVAVPACHGLLVQHGAA